MNLLKPWRPSSLLEDAGSIQVHPPLTTDHNHSMPQLHQCHSSSSNNSMAKGMGAESAAGKTLHGFGRFSATVGTHEGWFVPNER